MTDIDGVDDTSALDRPAATAEVAAKQASGSSFAAGMRVLPPPERAAMYAVYSFCRAVDDIADDQAGSRRERTAALDAWRADLDSLCAGGPPGRAAGLEEAVRRFGCERADFEAVIDGMQMDVDRDIRAPGYAELDLYCDRVASAVGRMSVHVFGMERGPGRELAFHLGRALQLTNILRDLDEDAAIGRLYLPREAIDLSGMPAGLDDPRAVVDHPAIDTACRMVAQRAHEHYDGAAAVLRRRPRGHLLAPRLMEAVYSRILSRMERVGWSPPRGRVSLSKARIGWLALSRSLVPWI